MSSDYAINEPQWETIENGWHAVAALYSKGYQWTAYIEYVDAPYWRVWAGCMFETLQQAQDWCRNEISHQMQRGEVEHSEPEAWIWLWDTLSKELGPTRAAQIRAEMAQRLHKNEQSA